MTPIVETQALGVRVGAKALLRDVTLSITPGETVALVGPNGAGKSTLLRTLSGEIAASTGHVLLKGQAPAAYTPRLLALHRAVLSQHVTVAFPFSVAEVVRMGAGDTRSRNVDALVDEALAEVDLDNMRERIINTLSGGEQQRAHFARVLVQLRCGQAEHGPGLLLLDEPTASLDLCHQLDLLDTVKRYNETGTTVVMIMHDLNLAAMFARRIVTLHDGAVAADGAPEAIITDDLLEHVFKVRGAVSRLPAQGMPYVLPHQARTLER